MSEFSYNWKLSDLKKVKKNGLKVFSTFACGGGSTMGYKLAGYSVIAANDIDPLMRKVYTRNHKPDYYFLGPIKDLQTKVLPKELYELDILDGSPPCSAFSVAGQREKNWGKAKKFREGQSKQILDDLFFDFLDLAEKLKPKVIIAENVHGMLIGKAKGYCIMIMEKLKAIGYNAQLFDLDSATMGVPQRRQRVFFIASRDDLKLPKLVLKFNEKTIVFRMVADMDDVSRQATDLEAKYWEKAKCGYPVGRRKDSRKADPMKVCFNVKANHSDTWSPFSPRKLNLKELLKVGTFPQDYDFCEQSHKYLIGMSVPPVMIARIAEQVYQQWFLPKE